MAAAATTSAATSAAVRSYTVGPPTAAVVPVGSCVFGEEFVTAPLVDKVAISHDTAVFTFGLADEAAPLNLPTCACLLAKGGADAEGKPIVRPYTPVSTNAMAGKFELMVKVYNGDAPGLSAHMDSMAIGDTLEFKHIPFNVKTQYPFNLKTIGMLVGGTGITPMVQALHAILGTEGDSTQVKVLYGSRTKDDILCEAVLDEWVKASGGRLTVTHVLSDEPEGSAWEGPRGFIGPELIAEYMPPASDDSCQLWICGPPPMYEALCGARGEAGVVEGTVLAEAGYSSDQVYKF